VDKAVEAGVRQGGLPNRRMPMVHEELTGHPRGPTVVAVIEKLSAVPTVCIPERCQAPVVAHEASRLGQHRHQLPIAPVTFGHGPFLQDSGQTEGQPGPAIAACLSAPFQK